MPSPIRLSPVRLSPVRLTHAKSPLIPASGAR